MRADMYKVIVERPRLGGGGRTRGPKNASMDELPSKESIKKRHVVRKTLNENLGPLRRFLEKQVGRPWDKIYSEISRGLRPTSAVQQHVRDHVWDYVTQHVEIEARKIYCRSSFGWRYQLRVGDLYIHPNTGLLQIVKRKRK